MSWSLNHDLGKDSEWCDLFRIKFSACKTKTMIVSRPRTMHPRHSLNYCRNCAQESDDLDILGLTFESMTTNERPLRSV